MYAETIQKLYDNKSLIRSRIDTMNKYIVLLSVLLASSFANALEVSEGKLETYLSFQSKYVPARDVHVWLPDGYHDAAAQERKYAVLYMHDDQMLFDATTTWNNQEWGVDEVAGQLQRAGGVRPFIVVGVNNGVERRQQEYFPNKPFRSLRKLEPKLVKGLSILKERNQASSDEYLKFLVQELKPFIDKRYAVHTDVQNTALMGSSMGGLISLYAISEYPHVFGAAACMSTHWPGDRNPPGNPIPAAFFAYMKESLPKPATHKIYFDHGTETLDASYPEYQLQADEVMRARGYSSDNWVTKVFSGHAHDETSWRSRLDIPLRFLFANPAQMVDEKSIEKVPSKS